MNTYKSKFSGEQIDQILTQAKRFYLDLNTSKWDEFVDAVSNNAPVFVVESENIFSAAISSDITSTKLSVTIEYWNGEDFIIKILAEGENGSIRYFEPIQPDGTMDIIIDRFINPGSGIETKQDRAEDAGFSTWDDYLVNYYFKDIPGGTIVMADTYHHTAETVEWDGKVYDIWVYDNIVNDLQYIITERHDSSYFVERSLKYNYDNAWCPFVAMLSGDLDISEYSADKVALDWLVDASVNIKLYIDRPEKCGVPIEELISDPNTYGSNEYTYLNEIFEWEGSNYYLWEYTGPGWPDSNKYYILTDTVNYNDLYPHSLEADLNNHWCPYITYLNEDKETGYDVDTPGIEGTTRREDEALISVICGNKEEEKSIEIINMESDVSIGIYIDDLDPEKLSQEEIDEKVNYWHENGGGDDRENLYVYTNKTIKWKNNTYYLWEHDEGVAKVLYLITDTIDYQTLYEKTIISDINNRICPYVAILSDDLEEYKNHDNSKDILISVSEL